MLELPANGRDEAGVGRLRAVQLDTAHRDPEACAEHRRRDLAARDVYRCAPSGDAGRAPSVHRSQGDSRSRRFGQQIPCGLDTGAVGFELQHRRELGAPQSRQPLPHSVRKLAIDEAKTQEVLDAASVVVRVRRQRVMCPLPEHVEEGAVQMLLRDDRLVMRPVERGAEREPKMERGSDVTCESTRFGSRSRHHRVQVRVGEAKREKSALATLGQHGARRGTKVAIGPRDDTIACEPKDQMMSDGFDHDCRSTDPAPSCARSALGFIFAGAVRMSACRAIPTYP